MSGASDLDPPMIGVGVGGVVEDFPGAEPGGTTKMADLDVLSIAGVTVESAAGC